MSGFFIPHSDSRTTLYSRAPQDITRERSQNDLLLRVESTTQIHAQTKQLEQDAPEVPPTTFERCCAAGLYAAASLGILWINKIILTTYAFPSAGFLAMSQSGVTLIAMIVLKFVGLISYPDIGWGPLNHIMPLPIVHMINVLSGLTGMKFVTLPMLTALRRVSIPMTMLTEWYVFSKLPNRMQQVGVSLMLVGAMVAASNDLSFNFLGYVLIMINNIATTSTAILIKKKADVKGQLGGTTGVLFYCTLISFPMMVLMTFSKSGVMASVLNFQHWINLKFLAAFLLSTVSGGILNFATIWSNKVNSATTTVVIGCLKNTVVSYCGMLMADYVYSGANFWGITISILGALVYSYLEFQAMQKKPEPVKATIPVSPSTTVSSDKDSLSGSEDGGDVEAPRRDEVEGRGVWVTVRV